MEQYAGCRDVLSAVGVGKEPIVADAVEALGQHVHQEAPDKLVRVKPHRLPAVRAGDAIVLPTERDAGVVGGNEAAVRDGDTMRVTGEIAQHLLGSRERRLAVDYPVDARSAAMKRLNVLFSASPACVLKNVNSPLSCASMSIASILPRNRRASTLTCTRKLEREATHRALSSENPPPGTIICTCG